MLHFCLLLCFFLYEYCLLDFFECLLSLTCILAFPSTVSVFVNISLLSHGWNCFCLENRHCGDSLHTLACFLVSWIMHLFAWMIIHYCLHSSHHAFTLLMFSVTHRLDWVGLARTMPCLVSTAHFRKRRFCLPSRNCVNLARQWPPSLHWTILGGSVLLVPETTQCSLLVACHYSLKLHIAQF